MPVRYSIIDRIAVGGMGEVFLARQEGIGGFRRTVVLKRLLPGLESDDDGDILRRFLDEARVAAALSHENVVAILEVGDDNGTPFLALEYVHGENAAMLRNKARRRDVTFPTVVVARIIADAARGLVHAHDAKDVEGRPLHIVHRDVSPKNIFIRADGLSKIGDFGIAKSAHRLSRTETGLVPGTLAYMSPEQALSGDVGPASDQFSLGIVLWELLCGERLFKADSPTASVRATLTKEIAAPSQYRPDAAPLDGIVMRMLERDAGLRYASLADVAAAIESALPETRADLGQRAVALFMDAVLGDELRERQRKIEVGPLAGASTSDATVVDVRPPPAPGTSESSAPAAGAFLAANDSATPSPFASFSSAPTSLTPSGTPATGTGTDLTDGIVDAVTQRDRPARSGAKSGSASSAASTSSPDARGAASAASTRIESRTALAAPGPDAAERARALARSTSSSRSSRSWAAAGAVAASALLALSAVAARQVMREPTSEERTLAYLVEARELNAIIHRDMFLAMADVAGVDEAKSLPVADALIELLEERLALVDAHARKPAHVRESERARVADAERALEGKARAALAQLGNEDLEMEALDMWDYDASAPARWMPPDPADVVQVDLANGGLDFAKSQAETRRRAVDRLLKRVNADVDAVHAKLDPIVKERERLTELAATVPASDLAATLARIAALNDEGKRLLVDTLGSRHGRAAAALAFVFVPHPTEFEPLHDQPPSVQAERARGDAPPLTR